MKQGTFLTRTVIWLFFFAILAYLGVYLAGAALHPLKTEPVYAYSMDRGVTVSGLLVRDELPVASGAALADVLPAEGERIGSGQTLARIYTDQVTLERERSLEEIAQQLEQLSYFSGTDTLDLSGRELDARITDSVAQLRELTARKQFTELEGSVQILKRLIFQRDYVYYGADGIEEMKSALVTRKRELEAQGAGGYTAVRAPEAGMFSALVDGFEVLVNPDTLSELTPTGFQAVFNAHSGEAEGGYLGKIIRGAVWYYAFMLREDDVGDTKEGSRIAIRFDRDFLTEIPMTVERVSKAENGEVLVVASSDRYLAETTLMRKQTAEMIQTSGSGLRVPKAAVRVLEDGRIGVYCLAGYQADFKQVKIVYEGESFFLVENERENAAALRVGDEVIVSGGGIYDGKVVAQ